MQKRSLGPCVTFFPQPATLVASLDAAGATNVMTASWVGIVSKKPPTLAVSLHPGRKTYDNIRRQGEFTVNLAPASLATAVDFCGLRSGREVDKVEVAGLTLVPARTVAVPVVAEAPLNVECRLSREVEVGEYRLLLGEILDIAVDEKAFDGEGILSARGVDPLVYLGGIREYWNLGEKVGTAYQDGLRLDP